MTGSKETNDRLRALERLSGAHGAALLVGAAVAITIALVLILNALAFAPTWLTAARVFLYVSLILLIAVGIVRPIIKLTRDRAASRTEQVFPNFEQRLVTFTDKSTGRDPFVELLAADTLEVARGAEPSLVLTSTRLMGIAAAGIVSLGILLWLITSAPGFMGYGANLLWRGPASEGAKPFYEVIVQPGDAAVRRKGDQLISAQLVGLTASKVYLYAKFQSASRWEKVEMQPQTSGVGFEFLLAGLPENVEYYVEANGVRSQHYNLRVIDLPNVKRIKVTYHFPSWSGLKDEVDENAGDLRGVQGTEAVLDITTDRPLANGRIVLDNSTELPLTETPARNVYQARLKMDKDGLYHVAAIDQGQRVRLTDDFFIEARKEAPPTIRITKPGRDYKASPIEEVTFTVDAEDDFGLNEVTLHYSVNGGPEQAMPLLKQKGLKQLAATTMLALEEHKLVPGDIVAFYATAKDARSTARTDMNFIEAQPYERNYMQSQSAGMPGGGGEGEDQNQISQRQKEIIAATFNQMRDNKMNRDEVSESGKFLGEVQSKLRDQAQSLARRMQSRELSQENQEFANFAKDMVAAAEAMTKAST